MTIASSNTLKNVGDEYTFYESASKCQKATTLKVQNDMTKLEYEDKELIEAQCNQCKAF